MIKYNLSIYIAKKKFFLYNFYCKIKDVFNLYDRTNTIVLVKSNGQKVYKRKLKNIHIRFLGINNYVEIHEPFYIKKMSILFRGSNNIFKLKQKAVVHKYLNLSFESENTIEIGEKFSVQSLKIYLRNAIGTSLKIGNNCMLSTDLEFRTSDAHLIYDAKTKEILNLPKDIEIGNHVWIAANTKLLKGAKLPDNCIVGANSLVTKAFNEENCIIAGSPAKVIKTGVNWHKCGPHQWDSYKDFV